MRCSFCQLADLFIVHLCQENKTPLVSAWVKLATKSNGFKMLTMRAAGVYVSKASIHGTINEHVDCVVRRRMAF